MFKRQWVNRAPTDLFICIVKGLNVSIPSSSMEANETSTENLCMNAGWFYVKIFYNKTSRGLTEREASTQERTTNHFSFRLISIKRVPRILTLFSIHQHGGVFRRMRSVSMRNKTEQRFRWPRRWQTEKNKQQKTRIISIEFTNNAHSVGKGELDESIYLTRNHRRKRCKRKIDDCCLRSPQSGFQPFNKQAEATAKRNISIWAENISQCKKFY